MDSKYFLITGCSTGIGGAAAIALIEVDYRVDATARKDMKIYSSKLRA